MKATISPYINNEQITTLNLPIGDVYQTADYGTLDASLIQGTNAVILIESSDLCMAIPIIIRKIESTVPESNNKFDCTSAYGYPGYITNRNLESTDIDKIIIAIQAAAKQANIVSIFLRLNPILNHHIWQNNLQVTQVFHGKTVFIDLAESLDIIQSAYSNNHKRDLKKLKLSGCTVHVNEWNHYPEFMEAYNDTMTIAQASKYYFFTPHYFEQLRLISGTQLHLITITNSDNIVISGALFFETNGIVQYHLGGTKNLFRTIASSKLLFDAAIEFFKFKGCAILHLGGGYGSTEDELFRFKSGFSNNTLTFSTLRIITDPSVYTVLVNARSSITEHNNNFFPLYRK